MVYELPKYIRRLFKRILQGVTGKNQVYSDDLGREYIILSGRITQDEYDKKAYELKNRQYELREIVTTPLIKRLFRKDKK